MSVQHRLRWIGWKGVTQTMCRRCGRTLRGGTERWLLVHERSGEKGMWELVESRTVLCTKCFRKHHTWYEFLFGWEFVVCVDKL